MTWLEHHRASEVLASEAEQALREGQRKAAQSLYRDAADAECQAIAALDHSKARTLGICAVSAASLYFKAGQYARAEEVAERWLRTRIPAAAKEQLRALLQSVDTAARLGCPHA